MKFVIDQERLYWWPIKVRIPNPDRSGQIMEETFEMQFAAVDEDTARATAEAYKALETDEERMQHRDDQLLNAVRDWRGVVDGDKNPIPFTKEMFLTVLRAGPWYREGIYTSYQASFLPQEARRKN